MTTTSSTRKNMILILYSNYYHEHLQDFFPEVDKLGGIGDGSLQWRAEMEPGGRLAAAPRS